MRKLKRFISMLMMISVLFSLLAGMPVSAAGTDITQTDIQSADVQKTGSITIDGDLTESAWADRHSLSKQIIGSNPEINANFATTWNNEYFYLGVEVTGVNGYTNYDNDSITYYFAPFNYRGTPYSQDDFQVQIFDKGATVKAGAPGVGKNDYLNTSDITVKYKSQANGYTMEIAMPWKVVGTMPKAGNNAMGFDIMAFSNGESTVMEWSGGNWIDTTQNGTLNFVCDGTEGIELTPKQPLFSVGDAVSLNITSVSDGDSVAIFKKGEETSISNSICTKIVSGAAITAGQIEFTKDDFLSSSNPAYINGLTEGEYVGAVIKNSTIVTKCTFKVGIILGAGWYKGDNHMHSTYSDGTERPTYVADRLKSLGMNYATLTDHNSTGGKSEFESQGTSNFIPIIGEEVTRWDGHLLSYGIQSTVDWSGTPQETIDRVLNNNPGKSFCYIAHPMWSVDMTQGGDWEWHDWSVTGYTGLEVWNAYYPHNYDEDYSVAAFQKWDELNKQGKHLYGMCNTDAHNPDSTLGYGWNVNYMDSLTQDNILNSMRTGSFYGTNGPNIDFTVNGNIMGSDVKLTGSTVTIYLSATCTSNLNTVNLIKNGEIINTWNPGTTTWSVTLDNVSAAPGDFFRMTAEGTDLFAFSNPIFIAKPNIATTNTSYTIEQAIPVSFSDNNGSGFPGAGGTSTDWIGIFKEGDTPGTSGVSSVRWCYLNGTQTASDSVIKDGKVNLEKLPVGNYFIGFFSNDGFTEICDRIHISVTDLPTPKINTTKTTYTTTQAIPVSISNNNGSGTQGTGGTVADWIGIYKEGDTPGNVDSTRWCYLNGTQVEPSSVVENGTVSLEKLPAGNYFIGFFSNGGYTEICDRINISITEQPAPYITADKSSYTSDQSISINFYNNNGTGSPGEGGTGSDWIAIYRKGDIPGGAGGPVAWLYLNGTQLAPTSAINNGTLEFSGIPDGEYYAIMLSSGVFVEMCNPVPFTITPARSITIGTLTGGSITADQSSVAAGTNINLTIIPDVGKQLKTGSLKYNDGTDHAITGTSFTMPASNVTVSAEFETIPSTTYTGDGSAVDPVSTSVTASVSDTIVITALQDNWNRVEEKISDSITNHVYVNMNGSTEVPGTIFEALQGKDITMIIKVAEGIEWIINGKDIKAEVQDTEGNIQKQTHWKNINLGVTRNTKAIPAELINGLLGSDDTSADITNYESTEQLSLTYEGSFGFTATLGINLGNTNTGKIANLYYYNPVTRKLELQSTGAIDKNGTVQLKFTHASDYVILIDNGETLKKEMDKITVTSKKTLYTGGTIDKSVILTTNLPKELKTMLANGSCNQRVTYKSSNPKVANVLSKGKVRALKEGKTTITTTVTMNGVARSFKTTITVKKAYIKLNISKGSLKKGQSFTYQAVGYGVDTSKIIWSTTEKSIVIIDKATGKAKAKSAGTDYVIAKVGSVFTKLKVTVKSF